MKPFRFFGGLPAIVNRQPIEIDRNFLSKLDKLIDSAQENKADIKERTAAIVDTYKPAKETK